MVIELNVHRFDQYWKSAIIDVNHSDQKLDKLDQSFVMHRKQNARIIQTFNFQVLII